VVERLESKIVSMGTRARKRRVAVLALLGLIVLAQTALIVHQIQHDAVAHNSNCVLCTAASHLAGGATTVQPYAPALTPVEGVLLPAARPHRSRTPLPYLSRGPPHFRP
jgi:hypothetical protein